MSIEEFKSAISVGLSRGSHYKVVVPGLSKEECMLCKTANINPASFNTFNWRPNGRSPALRLPFDLLYEPLTLEFYLLENGQPFKKLEAWKKEVFTDDFRFNDFDSYATGRNILVDLYNLQGSKILTAKYFNCYPFTVGPLPLSYESKSPQTFSCNFIYEYMTVE